MSAPDWKDIRIDTYTGGSTSVRLTHIPTGISAQCTEGPRFSQTLLRERAYKLLTELWVRAGSGVEGTTHDRENP